MHVAKYIQPDQFCMAIAGTCLAWFGYTKNSNSLNQLETCMELHLADVRGDNGLMTAAVC